MTDFRALCAELLAHYDLEWRARERIKAALADEPQGEGPTDEELNSICDCTPWHGSPRQFGREVARAVLARWCLPAPPPADGEVGELVEWLRGANWGRKRQTLATRAADLLTRLALQPVTVSERLPGAEDCDAEGRCWIHMPDIGTAPSWRLVDPRDIGTYHTHWLPAHALPLPTCIESD